MDSDLAYACAILRNGGLVAFPTETVYGLGADARNPEAVAKIFSAKGRPADHPLIVHLPSTEAIDHWVSTFPPAAKRLAERFWPGPLTMILPKNADVPDATTGGQPTVGIRVPDHPVALQLLQQFDGGLAAPSANRFGSVSPTTAAHVLLELGEDVDCILDGGSCSVGVESTIVDLSQSEPHLLRPGGIAIEAIEEVLQTPLQLEGSPTRAPGTLPSHYAPRAQVLIVAETELDAVYANERAKGKRVAYLSERVHPDNISLPHDSQAGARRLYAALREVDAAGYDIALVALPSQDGLGRAIADRLRRASAPRMDGT